MKPTTIQIIHMPKASRVAVWLLRQVCRTPQSRGGRLLQKVFAKTRKALINVKDPLVGVVVNGIPLLAPLSHELPVYSTLCPIYSQNIGRIARIVAEASPAEVPLIDIGANIGDTAAIVRSYCEVPILCIEGHPLFSKILQHNLEALGDRVSLEASFVHVTTGAFQGRWDYALGTARLVDEPSDAPDTVIPTRTLSDILQDHPAFEQARIVKIDTDGFDFAIIEAELTFFARQRPVLFFEYDPGSYPADHPGLPRLARRLHEIGYAVALVYDNQGYYMSRVALSDEDQLEDLEGYVRSLVLRSGYVDVCAFHEADRALAETVCAAERAV